MQAVGLRGHIQELLPYSVQSQAQVGDWAPLSEELGADLIPLFLEASGLIKELLVDLIYAAVNDGASIRTWRDDVLVRAVLLCSYLRRFERTYLGRVFFRLGRFLGVGAFLEIPGSISRGHRRFLRLEVATAFGLGHLGCDLCFL